MEQVLGIEPRSLVWKTRVIAIIRHLQRVLKISTELLWSSLIVSTLFPNPAEFYLLQDRTNGCD